ncbi:MAG: GTPase HflX [Ignavibacteria bacterium GWF2_33_9]|nr:MAG: GTPase HflX [Ignavibacteria bacterium GWF2_33_9]
MHIVDKGREKTIIATLIEKSANRDLAIEYLSELKLLVETAGGEIVEEIYQELEKPHVSTLMGKGKVQEIKELCEELNVKTVVFDNELTSVQVRNLSNLLQVKVLDRSGIILDIFASHAKSMESQLQVELAQNQYLLPRLSKMWTHLSKQYAGVGTKGPGETQIETDRRMVRKRIQFLKEKLKVIDVQNAEQRKSRKGIPRLALVGYTNAGKSTLMNAITDAGVFVEDKLFATLSTTVRQFLFPNGKKALLSDTVGFIRKLPHHLVASFRSTLSEAGESDMILVVVDVTDKLFRDQIQVVNNTLDSLGIKDKPIFYVFNKIDGLEFMEAIKHIESEYPNSFFVSAKKNLHINALLQRLQEEYEKRNAFFDIRLPYSKMNLLNKLYEISDVIARADDDDGILLKVSTIPENAGLVELSFKEYLILTP